MTRLDAVVEFSRRHVLGTLLVAIILLGVVAGLEINSLLNQADTARRQATVNATQIDTLFEQRAAIASTSAAKVETARREVIIATWEQALQSCIRGNKIRAAITANRGSLAAFELAAEKARRDAAATDVTAAQRRIDLKAADSYRALRLRLRTIPQVRCAELYPYPYPKRSTP